MEAEVISSGAEALMSVNTWSIQTAFVFFIIVLLLIMYQNNKSNEKRDANFTAALDNNTEKLQELVTEIKSVMISCTSIRTRGTK